MNTPSAAPRRVLIVAYHFPPDAEVGSRRPLSWTRHLPEHGWERAVLTVRPEHYERTDPDSISRIPPDLWITRTRQWPNLRDILHRVRNAVRGNPSGSGSDSIASAHVAVREKTAKVPAWKRHLSALSWTPDAMLGWYPPAVREGKRLIDGWHPDAVLATGPPWTALLVGKALAEYGKVPFIADFRDPWTFGEWKPDFGQTTWSRRWEKAREHSVVESAAAVTFVTEMLKERFASAFPGHVESFHAVYNGFEPFDLPEETGLVDPAAPVVLRHLGTLYVGRDFGPILEAAASLVKDGRAEPSDFRVENFGRVELPAERFPERLSEQLGIPGAAVCHPARPFSELATLATESDALLTISGTEQLYAIPYKTLEYLPLGRYILAVTPQGESGGIVDSAGAGSAVDPRDVAGIAEVLMKLLEAKRTGKRLPGGIATGIDPFSARHRTGEFAAILDSLVADSASELPKPGVETV